MLKNVRSLNFLFDSIAIFAAFKKSGNYRKADIQENIYFLGTAGAYMADDGL